ncbi:ATP-dependent DNA helicase [Caerostris extrusa]|uniref:ATP-dependent DNA helicase n=1 Tax=Caerostris extrusa TaxID=172846 RepID=A0AAV4WT13_CAEEX|nr:ATP-dependent DNA helicase [Caerostris extrusa]
MLFYRSGIHVLVANFKTKVRAAVLYAKPGSSDDDIIDAIDESLDSKNRDYKIVLAGNFNIDMGTNRRSTRRRRSKAGVWPDPWNFAAQIDWEGDDDDYPM